MAKNEHKIGFFFKWCFDTCKKCLPETIESAKKATAEDSGEKKEDEKKDEEKSRKTGLPWQL